MITAITTLLLGGAIIFLSTAITRLVQRVQKAEEKIVALHDVCKRIDVENMTLRRRAHDLEVRMDLEEQYLRDIRGEHP